jgi:hypothetical protein
MYGAASRADTVASQNFGGYDFYVSDPGNVPNMPATMPTGFTQNFGGGRFGSFYGTYGSSITIAPTTLPNGEVSLAYTHSVVASGGTGPYTYAVTGGTVPTGVTVNSDGTITGTPTTIVGSPFSFTITATDNVAATGNQAYSNVVIYSAIAIQTTTLPNGTIGSNYSQTIVAVGGSGGNTFAKTAGTLPTGLSLSSSGVLTGIPTVNASFTFTVTVTDSLGATASQSYTLIPSSVVITTNSFSNGDVGLSYTQTAQASGGSPPFTWSNISGTLPTGLSISSSGILSGIPSAQGTFNFTIQALDSVGASNSKPFTVVINPAVVITTGSLPSGSTGVAYSQTLHATGGTGAYTFSTTTGTLPTGLSLSSGGIISGVPTVNGSYDFTITAIDGLGGSYSKDFSISISGAVITITPNTLPNTDVGLVYSQTLTAHGGVGPYAFDIVSGSLPPGLTLSG